MNECHACLLTKSNQEIPLTAVEVRARLSGPCSEVRVVQRYVNREATDVEAVYVFPLPESASVCAFEAKVGERVIHGRVEERDRAFEVYDDAMAQGDGAFLLDQERPNVFTISVGNLKPGAEVELAITYVALVPREGDALRLTVPTTVSPRYVPARGPEVGQPDGERVNPLRLAGTPYGLSIAVEVAGQTRAVESPSHAVRVTLADGSATVALASDEVGLDRDFVLLVTPAEARRPLARVAREADGTRVAMVTFLPDEGIMGSRARHELLFLLDCSGSMQGDSIAQAKKALQLCIRALEDGDTFNVTCFGSSFTSLWERPRRFDAESLAEASRYVDAIDATLGGTELLAPMTALLEGARDPERQRDVLLLTDGQVSNEEELIALCGAHAGATRVFSFAIGAGASDHLVRGVARASRGAAEAIFPGERIEPKVLRTFRRVTSPALDGARLDWGGLQVEQAPAVCPPVFVGDSLTCLARVISGHAQAVTLHVGERSFSVPLELERTESGGPIPTLWARETIRALESQAGSPRGSGQRKRAESARKERLVAVAKRYGLLSAETSYVAVEERAEADKTKGRAALRRVPVAVTAGWHGMGSLGSQVRGLPAGMLAASGGTAGLTLMVCDERRELVDDPESSSRAADAPFPEGCLGEAQVSRAYESLAPAARPRDLLFEVLVTQEASGAFSLTGALCGWLGSSAEAARELAKREGETRVATSVVIALCETDAKARSDEWGPAVAKALRWLAANGGRVEVEELLSARAGAESVGARSSAQVSW